LELLKNYQNPMTERSRVTSVRGSIKILITNFGSVLSLFFILLNAEATSHAVELLTECSVEPCLVTFALLFCYTVVVPSFISTLNPAVYIGWAAIKSRYYTRYI